MHHVSYLVGDDELDADAKKLEDAGVEVERVDAGAEWELPAAVRFRTPAGHLVELTTGVQTEVPVAHMVSEPGSAPGPVACDHVGLGAPEFETEDDFWVDTIGLLRSNRIMAPGDMQVMSFLRAPARYLYHCVVVVRSEDAEMHHYQMTLKSVDAFYAAYESLKESGVDIQWGPLRHGPGHNIAMYFQDGAGHWVEYSVEEEIILDDESYVPRTWTVADPHVVDEWQSGRAAAGADGPAARRGGDPRAAGDPRAGLRPRQADAQQAALRRHQQGQHVAGRAAPDRRDPRAPAVRARARGGGECCSPRARSSTTRARWSATACSSSAPRARPRPRTILAKDPIHVGNFRKCTVYGWALHEGKINVAVNLSDKSYTFS